MKCDICNIEFDNKKKLSAHIRNEHKMSVKEYYDSLLKKDNEGFCQICGKGPLKFHGLNGYSKFCSPTCKNIYMHQHRSAEKKKEINEKISNSVKSELSQNKRKQTNLERYGEENPFSFNGERYKNTIKERYGVTNVSKIPKVAEKISKILSNKTDEEKKESGAKRKAARTILHDKFCKENDLLLYSDIVKEYGVGWENNKDIEIVKEFGIKFIHKEDVEKIIEYHELTNSHVSLVHTSVVQYIKSLGITNVKINCRRIITPLEIDIYLPDYKFGIEINGNFFHQSSKMDELYHLDKNYYCEEKGVRLIHIFESDWNTYQDKCKALIKRCLNIFDSSINAEDCEVFNVSYNEALEFLKDNWLRAIDVNKNASYLALKHGDEIVQLIQYIQFDNSVVFNINCTKNGINVVNGIDKLLGSFNDVYAISDISLDTIPNMSLASYVDQISFIRPQIIYCANKKYNKWKCVDSGRKILHLVNNSSNEDVDNITNVIFNISKFFTNYCFED